MEPRVRKSRCPLCGVRDVIPGWVLCQACDPWPIPRVTLWGGPKYVSACHSGQGAIITVPTLPWAVRMRARLAHSDPGNAWDDVVRVIEEYGGCLP